MAVDSKTKKLTGIKKWSWSTQQKGNTNEQLMSQSEKKTTGKDEWKEKEDGDQ